MFRVWGYLGLFSLLMSAACVDRLSFEIGTVGLDAIVIEGFITDQPGPYEVRVSQAFNIDSTVVRRIPVEVKQMILTDNTGNIEALTQINPGVYQTNKYGIQGVVGRAYKMNVQLMDGRTYETPFDTIRSTGSVEEINNEIVQYADRNGVPAFAFDIYFDAKAGDESNFRYLWKTTMTYKVQTNPENHLTPCPDGRGQCLDPLDCSGFIIDPIKGGLKWVKPCTCCLCWITVKPDVPVVSDRQIVDKGSFTHLKAGRLPITGLTMSYKTHIEIQQFSLSEQAYKFWKEFRAQKDGISSLFQPVSGKIIGNWIQIAGSPSPVHGVFYASSVSSGSTYLDITDLPSVSLVPPIGTYFPYSCLDFDNSINIQPDFWN